MKIKANGIDIEVDDQVAKGIENPPVVLLIMGLGMQLTSWPPPIVRDLLQAGFRVVRFDNRDIGLSQYFDHLGKPSLVWNSVKKALGITIKPKYSLQDMALDALGVLDTLKIERAHVLAVSMGAMIAQRMALTAPNRLLSLTSVMSSSGAPNLPGPEPHIVRALLARPRAEDKAAVINHGMKFFDLIASPDFPVDRELRRKAIEFAVNRAYHPEGTLRQMMAIVADAERHTELAKITVPTLVIHGKADVLVPHACGIDTAQRIPNAQFKSIPGMGHDLPPGVCDLILGAFLDFEKSLTKSRL
jgi:pimeloyl-ACP methyl ester carboxylesterase